MLISLRDLERSYHQGVARSYVLRRITLDIQPGEFVSIMGAPVSRRCLMFSACTTRIGRASTPSSTSRYID
jgi:ABC-type phosphate/phosphonate transport system ATPase subunit